MNMPILLRLSIGDWPLIRAFGIACATLGFGLLTVMTRGTLWPIEPGRDTRAMIEGSIAFLLAAMIAALLASAAWELRTCSFAWSTPHLARRVRREISIAGFLLFGCAAGMGASMHGALTPASWFPAILAALGFSIGLVCNLSPFAWVRFGGIASLLLATAPIFFMPEIAKLSSHLLYVWLFASIALLAVTTERCGRWMRSPTDRADGGPDARLFGTTNRLQSAPRNGADRFHGTRQSDLDWARAQLHQTYGVTRGGVIGTAVRLALATMILTIIVRLFFSVFSNTRPIDATTGGDPSAATTRFTLVPEALSGVSFDWFTKDLAWEKAELFVANIVAVILGTLLWNITTTRAALQLPVSRRRRAWIAWLATQIEEFITFGGVLAGLLMLAVLIEQLTPGDPWPILGRCIITALAVFALLPVMRMMRLWWLDTRVLAGTRDANAEVQDPRAISIFAVSMAIVVSGSILGESLWQKAAGHLRAAPILLPLMALVPIAVLRFLWLVALRRTFARADLR